MARYYPNLNQKNAFIWRIIHRDNLPWVLDNGLHCGNSAVKTSDWINIGNRELIDRRSRHPVPLRPCGFLNDYIPFYFTPFSPMLLNIRTGRGDVEKRDNEEIVILVSSLHYAVERQWLFVFTDMHACCTFANFYSDVVDLDKIGWDILQKRDFSRNPEDPHKFDRYQAEALIYNHLPVDGLQAIVCYTDSLKQNIERQLRGRGLSLPVYIDRGWYFS